LWRRVIATLRGLPARRSLKGRFAGVMEGDEVDQGELAVARVGVVAILVDGLAGEAEEDVTFLDAGGFAGLSRSTWVM